jgi:hypothetical protein
MQIEPATIAAFMSCTAAALSAVAAWRVPHKVASYADAQRRSGELRARKLAVLEVLLQHRAMIGFPASVAALNSITIIFVDDLRVRESYLRFMDAANAQPYQPGVLVERYIGIIHEIVAALQLDSKIGKRDLDAVYFPERLGREVEFNDKDFKIRYDAVVTSTANSDPRSL